MARSAVVIDLDGAERAALERLLRAPSAPQQRVTRARVRHSIIGSTPKS